MLARPLLALSRPMALGALRPAVLARTLATKSTTFTPYTPSHLSTLSRSTPILPSSSLSVFQRAFSVSAPAANAKAKAEEKPKVSAYEKANMRLAKIGVFFQLSWYLGVILAAIGLFGLVWYYLIMELVMPSGDVRIFNRAFKEIEKNEDVMRILGGQLSSMGEGGGGRWGRNQPPSSKRGIDKYGREHIWMNFYVSGDLNEGRAKLELVQNTDSKLSSERFVYRYFVVDIPGHKRIYIAGNAAEKMEKKKSTGWLGVNWGKANDEE
ncbi:Mitochondrial import inner membrane translocase subunit TIM21 [Yarrowia sp. B02]|nr:Mitochondrial import inner membrane translocase subunit TIM21 [Yarrowia sp. B02]